MFASVTLPWGSVTSDCPQHDHTGPRSAEPQAQLFETMAEMVLKTLFFLFSSEQVKQREFANRFSYVLVMEK